MVRPADIEARSAHRTERRIAACLDARLARRGRPYRVLSTEEVRPPLEEWLRSELGPETAVEELVRAPGGASKENFFFDAVSAGRRRSLLLRLDPGESIIETDRLREHQVLRAVEDALHAPRSVAVDADGARFGRPAILLEKVRGRTQPALAARTSGVGILFEPELRAKLAENFVDALVRLHAVEWRGADLSAYDVPRRGTTDAVEWSLGWWERVWEEDRLEDHPVVVLANDWLRERLPAADDVGLVHGDYRSGNFLYDETGITAILDWELAHLGDPHEDLGWVVNRLFAVRERGGERLVCGLFEREEFLDRYERTSGRRVDRERVRFYEVFNNYKLAVMCFATTLRVARGENTHLSASMSLIHAFSFLYVAELARALGIEGDAR